MDRQFCIEGMNCAGCAARVEKAVRAVSGVKSASVSLLTNSLTVQGDVADSAIIKAVENAGYKAKVKADLKTAGGDAKKSGSLLKIKLFLSIVFLLPLLYITMGHNMLSLPLPSGLSGNYIALGLLQLLLSCAVLIVNNKFFVSGVKAVLHKSANMDTLVSLGSGVSFLWSIYMLLKIISSNSAANAAYCYNLLYFESSAMIVVIISVGKLLESISKSRSTNAIKELLSLRPKKVMLITEEGEREADIDSIKVGDLFALHPGERVGVDGVVVNGAGAVDESAITGESMPVDKKIGDHLRSGSINLSGYLICRAEKVADDSTLSQIIKLVEKAGGSKPPIARTADKISAVFSPSIIVLSLIVVLLHLIFGSELAFAIERGISTLVISCPCALGLATPVAVMVASGVGAKSGIFIKNAEALEGIAKTKTLLLDKTGTITEGRPAVSDVLASGVDEGELLELAYALESKSEHPLSLAICQYAKENNIRLLNADNFLSIPGEGLEGEVDGSVVRCGSQSYIEKNATIDSKLLEKAEEFSKQGKTLVFVSKEDRAIGVIGASDVIKESSFGAIRDLKALGLNIIMLTGDNKRCAEYTAERLGIDSVYSSLLPQDKEAKVRQLKANGLVAMVGDGINDAPSLSSSDVSIAIGAGSDIAVESSQVILVSNSLDGVVRFVKLGRRTLRNIKENLFWAFFYNIICIPIAAGAFNIAMSPMFAAFAMSFSSITVCLNALRLNRFKKEML